MLYDILPPWTQIYLSPCIPATCCMLRHLRHNYWLFKDAQSSLLSSTEQGLEWISSLGFIFQYLVLLWVPCDLFSLCHCILFMLWKEFLLFLNKVFLAAGPFPFSQQVLNVFIEEEMPLRCLDLLKYNLTQAVIGTLSSLSACSCCFQIGVCMLIGSFFP